jgi:hypothetical protein
VDGAIALGAGRSESIRIAPSNLPGPAHYAARSARLTRRGPRGAAGRGHPVDCEAPFGQQLHHVPVRQSVACTPLRPSDHQPDTSVDLAEISSVSRGTNDFIALN